MSLLRRDLDDVTDALRALEPFDATGPRVRRGPSTFKAKIKKQIQTIVDSDDPYKVKEEKLKALAYDPMDLQLVNKALRELAKQARENAAASKADDNTALESPPATPESPLATPKTPSAAGESPPATGESKSAPTAAAFADTVRRLSEARSRVKLDLRAEREVILDTWMALADSDDADFRAFLGGLLTLEGMVERREESIRDFRECIVGAWAIWLDEAEREGYDGGRVERMKQQFNSMLNISFEDRYVQELQRLDVRFEESPIIALCRGIYEAPTTLYREGKEWQRVVETAASSPERWREFLAVLDSGHVEVFDCWEHEPLPVEIDEGKLAESVRAWMNNAEEYIRAHEAAAGAEGKMDVEFQPTGPAKAKKQPSSPGRRTRPNQRIDLANLREEIENKQKELAEATPQTREKIQSELKKLKKRFDLHKKRLNLNTFLHSIDADKYEPPSGLRAGGLGSWLGTNILRNISWLVNMAKLFETKREVPEFSKEYLERNDDNVPQTFGIIRDEAIVERCHNDITGNILVKNTHACISDGITQSELQSFLSRSRVRERTDPLWPAVSGIGETPLTAEQQIRTGTGIPASEEWISMAENILKRVDESEISRKSFDFTTNKGRTAEETLRIAKNIAARIQQESFFTMDDDRSAASGGIFAAAGGILTLVTAAATAAATAAGKNWEPRGNFVSHLLSIGIGLGSMSKKNSIFDYFKSWRTGVPWILGNGSKARLENILNKAPLFINRSAVIVGSVIAGIQQTILRERADRIYYQEEGYITFYGDTLPLETESQGGFWKKIRDLKEKFISGSKSDFQYIHQVRKLKKKQDKAEKEEAAQFDIVSIHLSSANLTSADKDVSTPCSKAVLEKTILKHEVIPLPIGSRVRHLLYSKVVVDRYDRAPPINTLGEEKDKNITDQYVCVGSDGRPIRKTISSQDVKMPLFDSVVSICKFISPLMFVSGIGTIAAGAAGFGATVAGVEKISDIVRRIRHFGSSDKVDVVLNILWDALGAAGYLVGTYTIAREKSCRDLINRIIDSVPDIVSSNMQRMSIVTTLMEALFSRWVTAGTRKDNYMIIVKTHYTRKVWILNHGVVTKAEIVEEDSSAEAKQDSSADLKPYIRFFDKVDESKETFRYKLTPCKTGRMKWYFCSLEIV